MQSKLDFNMKLKHAMITIGCSHRNLKGIGILVQKSLSNYVINTIVTEGRIFINQGR